jgi:hyperosmotically inducible periplasmic protein
MKSHFQIRVLAAALLAVTSVASQAQSDVPSTRTTAPASDSAPVVSTRADNSELNTRDKSDATLTPMDQPNNKADLQTLADVRKAVVGDKSLSTLAHNVKILAINGVVTLRGPVKSASEKTQIAALAARTSGVSKVDNQLDIKSN